jgi:hypothetical protein
MIEVKLDLREVNQALAALEYWRHHLDVEWAGHQGEPRSRSRDEAIDILVDARFWAEQASLSLRGAEPFHDHPAQMTWTAT